MNYAPVTEQERRDYWEAEARAASFPQPEDEMWTIPAAPEPTEKELEDMAAYYAISEEVRQKYEELLGCDKEPF